MDIREILKNRREILDRKRTENRILEEQISEKQTTLKTLSEQLGIGQEALLFLEEIANSRRNTVKEKLEKIVTEAVHLIYGDTYSVDFEYSTKNNRSCLEIKLVKQTPKGDVRRDMDGFGGGVSDTISVPLRLMILLASKQTDKVCVLDEPYKHIDTERIDLVAQFIREVCLRLGVQVIMLSHHETMQDYAETMYSIKDVGGKSSVIKVK